MTGLITKATLALLTATLAAAPSAMAERGYYVEKTITSEDGSALRTSQARGWVRDGSLRVEFSEGDDAPARPGTYLITRDGGENFYLIDPEQQTYSEFSTADAAKSLFSGLGDIQKAFGAVEQEGDIGAEFQLEFTDPYLERLGSEPGESVLGHPTTRHRWRSTYRMNMKFLFFENSHHVESTTEVWTADSLAIPALQAWFKNQFSSGNPEMDRLLSEPMRDLRGVVLKVRQESTMTDSKERTSQSTSVSEVTTLREESIGDQLFVIPEGYRQVPPPGASGLASGEPGRSDPPTRGTHRTESSPTQERSGLGGVLGAFGGGGRGNRVEEESGGSSRPLGRLFGRSRRGGGEGSGEGAGSGRSGGGAGLQDSRTGTLEATFDDRSLNLGTFLTEEGNTAAWMPLGDGSYGVFINAFSDESFSPRGAVSIRMVFSDLDGNCPCAPIELVIRYYQGGSYQGQYYESQNVRAVLTRLQRIDGENFEVEGNFAGRFGFLQSAGGQVGRTVAGKGNFRAVVERVRQ